MSIFGWSYPAGCSSTPYDDEPPEACPQCSADNSDAGQFALVPNNYLTYNDAHFVDPDARENTKHYRRGETVYWEKS